MFSIPGYYHHQEQSKTMTMELYDGPEQKLDAMVLSWSSDSQYFEAKDLMGRSLRKSLHKAYLLKDYVVC